MATLIHLLIKFPLIFELFLFSSLIIILISFCDSSPRLLDVFMTRLSFYVNGDDGDGDADLFDLDYSNDI